MERLKIFLMQKKGSRVVGEVLYYLGIDWINRDYKYEQDHLHPYEGFESKPVNVSFDEWKSWRGFRNRLPNASTLGKDIQME